MRDACWVNKCPNTEALGKSLDLPAKRLAPLLDIGRGMPVPAHHASEGANTHAFANARGASQVSSTTSLEPGERLIRKWQDSLRLHHFCFVLILALCIVICPVMSSL